MSNRRAKRERVEQVNRNRLRYLIAVLSLEDLQRVGVVPKDAVEKPSSTSIERLISERLNTFRKADTRLRKKTQPDWIQRRFDVSSKRWLPVSGDTRITGNVPTAMIVDELHELPES